MGGGREREREREITLNLTQSFIQYVTRKRGTAAEHEAGVQGGGLEQRRGGTGRAAARCCHLLEQPPSELPQKWDYSAGGRRQIICLLSRFGEPKAVLYSPRIIN